MSLQQVHEVGLGRVGRRRRQARGRAAPAQLGGVQPAQLRPGLRRLLPHLLAALGARAVLAQPGEQAARVVGVAAGQRQHLLPRREGLQAHRALGGGGAGLPVGGPGRQELVHELGPGRPRRRRLVLAFFQSLEHTKFLPQVLFQKPEQCGRCGQPLVCAHREELPRGGPLLQQPAASVSAAAAAAAHPRKSAPGESAQHGRGRRRGRRRHNEPAGAPDGAPQPQASVA
mmetsp:Transcript_21169/g.33956  ORF Transcript_21169/g.33956 Transcript_21169/m.33956 type:complete len:229 (+) Transcript_21169:523-1209(+)